MIKESIAFNEAKFTRDSIGGRGFHRQSTAMLGIDSKFMNASISRGKIFLAKNFSKGGYREYSKKELTQDLKVDFYLFNQVRIQFFLLLSTKISVQTNL